MVRAIVLALLGALPLSAATPCRLDHTNAAAVQAAAHQIWTAYSRTGKELPFHRTVVNVAARPERTLRIEIVADAPSECAIQGLCQAAGSGEMLIRCSAGGVRALIGRGDVHPALAYVLAHEVAHLLRRDEGLFLNAIATVPVSGTRAQRVQMLKNGCEAEPQLAEEEAADALALEALVAVVAEPPFRQTMLNARGSLYWNVDEILLAANRFQESQGTSPVKVHRLFDMEERPSRTDEPFFDWAARRFVCDALNGKDDLRYPLRASTHPAPEERLRRIAARIEAVAQQMVDDGKAAEYQRRVGAETAMKLQEDVGAILNRMKEQDGEYLAALHSRVCSIVNLEAVGLNCGRLSAEPPPEPEEAP